ncbi:VanZ family protein [Blastococcus xanthinilyticus]|uniref:Glycopeptide antibiotics resistance protein n=1 Tax=Blastococcus xanthinilyticus TaxID=1564164 RepID=A0A5S5D797_9ACTN|nr:VanZ family protein [Blastococcus xanthinilyticus]TYP90499.1 glycopeptide antibiotics resistance protein [Blastococcus xanthinilyticus]
MLTVLDAFLGQLGLGAVLALLALAVLAVPVLAVQYRRLGAVDRGRTAGIYLLVVYAVVVVALTLLPLPTPGDVVCAGRNVDPLAFVGAVRADLADGHSVLSSPALFQLLYNVAMFVPGGVLLRRSFRWPLHRVLLAALASSALIEAVQGTGVFGLYDCAYRVLDVDDVLTNVSGALVGALLAPAVVLLPRPGHVVERSGRSGPLRRATAAAADFLLAALLAGLLGESGLVGAGVVLLFVFVAVPVLTGGATPGQHLVRAAVVRRDGRPAARSALILRGVLISGAWFATTAFSRWTGARAAELPGLVVVAPLVAFIGLVVTVIGTVAVRRDNRAPQDLLTGTEVQVRPRFRARAADATDGC